MLEPDHLSWSLRNGLALAIAFWIGFFGYSPGCADGSGNHGCFIQPYNSSIAGTIVVLLSKFAGSTIKAGLNRLAAVVLANVLGQMGWVLFGWCNLESRLLTGAAVFFLVWMGMFISYAKGEYASLGMRVGAIGAMSLLTACSDGAVTVGKYSGDYHGVISIVLSVTIMLMVDLALAGKPASAQAEEKLCQAMKNFQAAFEALLRDGAQAPDKTAIKTFLTAIGNVRDDATAARALAVEAKQEPRWWKYPFRGVLFGEVVDCILEISRSMSNLAHVLKDIDIRMVNVVLDNRPDNDAFRPLNEQLKGDIASLVEGATKLVSSRPRMLSDIEPPAFPPLEGRAKIDYTKIIAALKGAESNATEISVIVEVTRNIQSKLHYGIDKIIETADR